MKKRSLNALLGVGVLLCLGFAFWHSDPSTNSQAFAQEGLDLSAAPEASPFLCPTIVNVAVWDNRIHFRCNVANGSVVFYAYATDPPNIGTANQMLAIGNSAFVLDQSVYFYYNTNSNLNPPGCLPGDCRGLVGVKVPL